MNKFEKIKELNEKIAALIKEKPELQELQDEINRRTKDVNSHNKIQIIMEMLVERRNRMIGEANKVASLCDKARLIVKNIDWGKK